MSLSEERANQLSTRPTRPAALPVPDRGQVDQHRFLDTLAESQRPARPEPRPKPPTPPRTCVVCTEQDVTLIKACRACPADYCEGCLVDMFEVALDDNTRFPPRCCAFIQLYTVLPELSKDVVDQYRSKFEEWMTVDKVYCPSPSCSAYIPAKLLLDSKGPSKKAPTLETILSDALTKVNLSQYARFFRGDLDPNTLPGYGTIVTRPIDLKIIQAKLNQHEYTTTDQLTADMCQIVSNARLYNGPSHPVSNAAESLFREYLTHYGKAVDNLIAHPQSAGSIVCCPKCHVGLCIDCKQVEHQDKPCDRSREDAELAMLATFGYKRCPRCKIGVRRMFGCSHIQCNCGAHWCWWCTESIDDCMGGCAGPGSDEDEDDEDEGMDEGDDGSDDDSEMADAAAPPEAAQPGTASTAIDQQVNRPPAVEGRQVTAHGDTRGPVQALSVSITDPVNLDAGGARRWADAGLDFGDEPEETGVAQVWSCSHDWSIVRAPDDGFNHGNLDLMECNRCFEAVKHLRGSRKKRSQREEEHIRDRAWECLRCRLIVCPSCKAGYEENTTWS